MYPHTETENNAVTEQMMDTAAAMEELRPEIESLVEDLLTLFWKHHKNQESDDAIAESVLEVFKREEYAVLQGTLWSQKRFWNRLTAIMMTEMIDHAFIKDAPTAEGEMQSIHAQLPGVLEIVRKELLEESEENTR